MNAILLGFRDVLFSITFFVRNLHGCHSCRMADFYFRCVFSHGVGGGISDISCRDESEARKHFVHRRVCSFLKRKLKWPTFGVCVGDKLVACGWSVEWKSELGFFVLFPSLFPPWPHPLLCLACNWQLFGWRPCLPCPFSQEDTAVTEVMVRPVTTLRPTATLHPIGGASKREKSLDSAARSVETGWSAACRKKGSSTHFLVFDYFFNFLPSLISRLPNAEVTNFKERLR